MKNYIRKIQKQETYLGENKKKNYFEGWYFKFTTADQKTNLSIIPGITKGTDTHAFIQVIDNIQNQSHYFRYNIKDFSYSHNPFYIQIKNNYFSLEKIILNIEEIHLNGEIHQHLLHPIKKSFYSPNIMGPFAYLSFLECYHAVISLGHKIDGILHIYDKKIDWNQGNGYIEKDYGTSFPQKYIWMQGYHPNHNTILFLSIATVPLKKIDMTGIIGILFHNNNEYRFATYYNTKLKKMKKIGNNQYQIQLQQGKLTLEIELTSGPQIPLVSPKQGAMRDTIQESLESTINIKLYKNNQKIIEETLNQATTEICWNEITKK